MFNNQLIGKDKYITVVADNKKYLIEEFQSLEGCSVFATKKSTLSLKDLISKDFYKFESYENNSYITFEDGFPINEFIYFKIVSPEEMISIPFEFDKISSITPSSLNANFQAFQDLCVIMQNYMNDRMFRVDKPLGDCALPELNANEVWKRSEDNLRYEAFNVGAIEENIANFWKIFEEEVKKALDKIVETGDTQVDRINGASSDLNNQLQMMWRMCSILTGSQRYLSGNVLTLRNPTMLEKTVVGGRLSERVGNPKRVYNGNTIVDRKIKEPIVVDLGEWK